MAKTFYITTPIYYPNGEPHLGHVYTTLATDTIARYHRLAGNDVRFLTGTDEHGIKMVKTADEKGMTPEALATKNADVFRNLWKELHVTNDDFIRTSEPRHKAGVQEIVRKLLASDDIYLGGYEGWYDEGQEEFITETDAKAADYKSAVNKKPLVRYKEPSYFFRLSKWAPKVLEYIEQNPTFIQPESRRNEVTSKLKMQLKEGFQDLSISRATLKWGVPMPNDPEHVVYVWIDALSNYITALGYGGGDTSLFDKYWPADGHLIGKEILWFHTVYWPAMLFALGLPAPKQVYAHGWWTSEGEKMSKTLGNFIDIEKLREVNQTYGQDGLRYYCLRAAVFGSDLDWKAADLNTSYNELGNVVGNLLNRVINMTTQYRDAVIPAVGETDDAIDAAVIKATEAFPAQLAKAYEGLALQQAALLPVELARAANGYVDVTQPFKMSPKKAPEKAARLDTVLNLLAQATYRALVGLLPVLPEKAKEGLAQLGVSVEGKTLADLFSQPLPAGHKLGEGKVLFPKVI